jgi:hypothetical protein
MNDFFKAYYDKYVLSVKFFVSYLNEKAAILTLKMLTGSRL